MDVLIFQLDGQHFSVPALDVVDVRDPMPVTPLPFSPPYVDGLVNVAGRVVTQMDASLRLGLGQRVPVDQGSALLLQVAGVACVLHVQRVLTKIAVDEAAIAWCEPGGSPSDGARPAAVRGEFAWNGIPVLLLDAAIFSLDGIEPQDVPSAGGGLLGTVPASANADRSSLVRADGEFACVVVQCEAEHYAIRLDDVCEIVEAGELMLLPHAPAQVSGMALLRGTPLLGLSLAALLGRSASGNEAAMVVVASRGIRFGLLTEKVIGIESFARDSVQAAEQGQEVEGYLIGRGETMIGLLRVDGVISDERMTVYRQYLAQSRGDDSMEGATAVAHSRRRMLAFRLGHERCALPLEWVDRVEEGRTQTRVPEGDDALSGVVQIQGEVAPVVDLRRAMGLPCQEADACDSVFLVVRIDGSRWALRVDRIDQVVELAEADIEPARAAVSDYVGAVGRWNGQLLSILTLEPLKLAA